MPHVTVRVREGLDGLQRGHLEGRSEAFQGHLPLSVLAATTVAVPILLLLVAAVRVMLCAVPSMAHRANNW